MQITDVKIRRLFDQTPMKAVVSITFDNVFAVHDIKVIYAHDRYFVVMPSKKIGENSYRDIAHPISVEFRSTIEEAVLNAYQAELENSETETN